MIRAPMGDRDYWNQWVSFREGALEKYYKQAAKPSKRPIYRPRFLWNISIENMRFFISRYSRGDSIRQLDNPFPGLLYFWEESNELSQKICAEQGLESCRDWTFSLSDLNHYNWCFWLVGLALVLEIPEDQWQRLVNLIGDEGKDVLLDRVMASRQSGRKIGSTLLHERPYARLLAAIDAPKVQQPELLRDFVTHWYAELARTGEDELWWYIYGDPEKHPLEKGSYFGRWCLEAVAAVKAFDLDDSLCLGHEHYPGDLLRPDGPSTHSVRRRPGIKGWLSRLIKQ